MEEIIISYAVILMALILIANVFCRTVLNHSLTFAEEIGQFLLIITTFVGTSYAVRKGKHIRMSALINLFPASKRKIVMSVISLFTSVVMFMLSYYGYKYTVKLIFLGTVSPALRFPMYLIVSFVPITLFITGIEYFFTAIKNLKEKQSYISTELIDELCE